MPVNLDPHALIGKSDRPDSLIELTGYLGPSPLDGNVRLHFGLDFRFYCEIPTADGQIVLTEEGKEVGSPTRVFLKANTRIDLIQICEVNVEASFLRGKIATEHLPSAVLPKGVGIGSPGHPTNALFHCQPAFAACTMFLCHMTTNCPATSRH